ncbi:MAG: precorrin-6Y C5,15-methyltransferase (decarboxylating) subunit CbiT [Clostridiales bacterium]|nr:precorrin-6Y C5,15-methyltransferase (decarboxylating) subunit CbiT [Clostridiales bacterium]
MIKQTFGLKDSEFIRGDVPMTKEEVRVITISKLSLDNHDTVLDIGAGTGSISVECARVIGGHVYAIERNPSAVELIHLNKEKFDVPNLHIIDGFAPENLPNAVINKIIIGGSGGKMQEIFTAIEKYPVEKIVINTITLENTTKAVEQLKVFKYKDIEVVTVNIAKSKMVGNITMMIGQNPINIITGAK